MSNVGFVKYCKVFFLSFFLSASNLVKKVFRQVWFLFCRVKSYLFKCLGSRHKKTRQSWRVVSLVKQGLLMPSL